MYNTTNEINFIKGLGTWCDRVAVNERLVKKLEGYLEGASRRVYWGKIHKDEVVQFAKARLEAARLALAKSHVLKAS